MTRKGAFMKSTRKWLAVGAISISALGASTLSAVPAYAVTTLNGIVRDAGVGIDNVHPYLYQLDAVTHFWNQYDAGAALNGDGTWTLGSPADDGQYAFFYMTDATESAPYSSNQGWDGSVDFRNLTTEFTVTLGVPSITTFSEDLLRNAGIVSVSLKDGNSATPLVGSADSGWGSIHLDGGYSATSGSINQNYDTMLVNAQFTSTISLAHVLPGTYFDGAVDAENIATFDYREEPLDPMVVTVGAITNVGDVKIYKDGLGIVDLPNFAVTVGGTPKVDELLTATVVPSAATVSYSWALDGRPLIGAYAPTLKISSGFVGSQLAVQIIAREAGLSSSSYFSNRTTPVGVGDPNAATIKVTGTAKFGSTLKATVTGGTAGATNAFQWYRSGAPIAGADGSSYTLTKSDVAKSVFASVRSVLQGHTDAVIPSFAFPVAKDAVVLTGTTAKSIKSSAKPKIALTLKAGASGITATASVKIYYTSTKFITVTKKAGTTTVTLPKLKKGTTNAKIVYPGTGSYAAKTITVKVVVK